MGEVYVAENLGRRVALKVLQPDAAHDPGRIERFRREAGALAALGIPTSSRSTPSKRMRESPSSPWSWSRVVPWRTKSPRGIQLRELLDIAIPFAEALSAAQEKGIVDRDLKPANVVRTAQGQAKILDFGLGPVLAEAPPSAATVIGPAPPAALTVEGRGLGTVPTMAPWQFRGMPADSRADIFSLGVLLYEPTTGRRPSPRDTAALLMSAILYDEATPSTSSGRTSRGISPESSCAASRSDLREPSPSS
jgi:serine/threonine protein kinase